jgi:EAL domain-containing protein (putative c-di-GMP-specific phosphodiesterase class I)
MKTLIDRLQQPGAIRMEFQPIVRVHPDGSELYALEALARGPEGSSVARPDVLFEYARRKGEESAVDLICIAEALAASAAIPHRPLLSINIHGATLANVEHVAERLLEAARRYGIAPDQLMLEIVEHRASWAIETFKATLETLREAGVRIAVDDLGAGASNYRMIVDCRPDHLKIDRHVVHGCSRDPWRRAVLQSIVTLAQACDATPIAEGIEDTADLDLLLDLGINTVQGWLFARSLSADELAKSSIFHAPALPHRLKGQ